MIVWASDVVASRPSQSPRLDRLSASHSRRNAEIPRTARSAEAPSEPETAGDAGGSAAMRRSRKDDAELGPVPQGSGAGSPPPGFGDLDVGVVTERMGTARTSRSARGGTAAAGGTGGRARRPALREQLRGALEGEAGHVVALAQARVRLAVGHVGAEAPVLHHHRAAGRRIGTQLP